MHPDLPILTPEQAGNWCFGLCCLLPFVPVAIVAAVLFLLF